MGWEEGLQGPIVKGQQFLKGTVAGPEKAHIGIYRITGYPLDNSVRFVPPVSEL
jgi:hypothetical protein